MWKLLFRFWQIHRQPLITEPPLELTVPRLGQRQEMRLTLLRAHNNGRIATFESFDVVFHAHVGKKMSWGFGFCTLDEYLATQFERFSSLA